MRLSIKHIFFCLAIASSLLCGNSAEATTSAEQWKDLQGTYTHSQSNQYNSGILRVKDIGNDCVIFDFSMMAGSESEDSSFNYDLAGICPIDENGVGVWEDPDMPELKLTFTLKGKDIIVTQKGELPIAVSGTYNFCETDLELTEQSALELIKNLPSMVTGLNTRIGTYDSNFDGQLIDDWFYTIRSIDINTGIEVSVCLVAKDLSCVYRADDKCDPKIIFGSNDNMMKAKALRNISDIEGSELEEVAIVNIEGLHSNLKVGESLECKMVIPANLPGKLVLTSSDPDILSVEGNKITAKSVGDTTINITIEVDGSSKSMKYNMSIK